MKLRNFAIGLIFAISMPVAKAQVFEMYHQGFETTETVRFTASSSTNVGYDSQLHASGSRSLKLTQSTTEAVEIITDTIDFTQNTTLHYITLEFDHICNASKNNDGTVLVGRVYAKVARASSSWSVLNNQTYNMTRGGSPEFYNTATFSIESYQDWSNSVMTNDYWKSERFDLDQFLNAGVPTNERKLLIKFELVQKTSGSANGRGWWIDNLRVRSSQNQMITPSITMRCYPDGGAHPSSRGARITLDARTTVPQGICPDSVYVVYTVGSDTTLNRLTMTSLGLVTGHDNKTYSRFTCRIPFEGYDTTMRFYCVVKDNTTNFNDVTFPEMANSWVEYHCVRGVAQPGLQTDGFTGTMGSAGFPFPPFADGRSEWVYDSALLADAGYKAGSIVAMRYKVFTNNSLQSRPNFQIRMKNIPTSYTQNPDGQATNFMADYMHAVYDSTLVIDEVGAGVERTINLQDTFFYAGKDILVQMIYDGSVDMGYTSVASIPAPANKKSIYFFNASAIYGYNPYTSDDLLQSNDVSTMRPAFVMTSTENMPLVYDLGVSSIAFPNETNPIITQPSYIDVNLKNYGVSTVNSVVISYTIDDTIFGDYEWTGALAGGAETTVRVATGVTLPAGYHYIRSWVEDTLTVGTMRVRDHEPFNDTSMSEYIVCSGPLNGVRYVGGDNADYNNIEEFLFSLNQCGVNDSLVVRIAEGEYPPFVVPEVDGVTAQHYVVLEPVAGATVTIKANGVAPDLANLENSPYIRLRGLKFIRTEGALNNMVLMGPSSTGCRVENCTFIDSLENPTSNMRIASIINTGFAEHVIISGNTITGGDVGINLAGQAPDIRSYHNRLTRNILFNQYSSAIAVTNQSDVLVDKNELYDVLSNSSFVMRLMNCQDTVKILGNKIYTSHGAQALGVNNLIGTPALHILIANNMVVCADDGLANLQNTPFNIIAGQWMDVVYNSIKMTAPTRNNVATATFGGGVLSNSRFMNNIVACYDQYNYAFNFMPGNQVTNTVGHNIYYSEGAVLNRRTGSSFMNLDAWQNVMTDDTNSISVNPMFLNGSLVDLRTFNRLVKGVGIPMATVPTDMFDTVRSLTATCAGAFEFVSLFYDYEVEALFNPMPDNCDMPEQVELVIGIRNSGVNPYVPGGSISLSGAYSINGSATHTFAINRTVPAEDTIIYHTGAMVSMPVNGIYDSVYYVKIWTICPSDPNQTNDTNTFQVISRYHAEAPNNITRYIPYNTFDTLVATGATQWPLYNSSDAPTSPSVIYWYYSPDDTEPFQSGNTYITDVLREDTNFYVRQHREIPIVRITQVQLFSADTVVGLTNPMPEWIHANAKVVVQLTNVGDDTAHIENDSLLFVSPTNSYNNKAFKFPAGVTIAPGKSLVVQFTNSSMANQLPYMLRASIQYAPLHTTDFGLVYRSNGVKDAVAFNNVTTATTTNSVRWSNLNVPSYVWSGPGLPLANNIYAGVIRQAFNGNSQDWIYATEDVPMHLATVDPTWLRYTANGCDGDVGVISVRIAAPPQVDLELSPVAMPEGCGLGDETVSVRVQNFGIGPANNVQLNYSARGNTVTETLTAPIPASGDTVYSFVTPLNMVVSDDTIIDIVIWATSSSLDTLHLNDTCSISVLASHTPDMPVFADTVQFQYATSDTLTLSVGSDYKPIWYDYNGNAVDTGEVHITDILYSDGVMGVSLLHQKDSSIHIGNLTSLSTKNAYPSPYQPKSAQSKQQYIYSAHELMSMGLEPGAISAVAFHLDSIHKVNSSTQRDSVVFNSYSIYLGMTTDTIFANATAWKTAQLVYSRNNMTIYRSQSHNWIEHQFDTPFIWDGEHSIVVQVVAEISPTISTGVQTAYTTKANTVLTKDGATVGASFTGSGTKGGNRPDILFTGKVNGCNGPIKYFNVVLNGVPETDGSIFMLTGTNSGNTVYNSCGNLNMNVVMRNRGRNPINGYQLHYSIDGAAMDTTVIAHTVLAGQLDTVQMFSHHFMPGHHRIVAAIHVNGDIINTNDTIRMSFSVRFCAGTYTIGAGSGYDYHSFGEAIDSMEVAGIDGPVIFDVAGGEYNEQVVLGEIEGSSPQNKITFMSAPDSVATIIAVNTNSANYVVNIDGLSNVEFDGIKMLSRPAGSANTAHVFVVQNAENVTVTNCILRVKGTVHNQNGSCVMLNGNVQGLKLISNILDSGYYSLTQVNNSTGYRNFTIQENVMSNFNFGGISIKGLTGINITKNTISSYYRSKMTGIALENVDSTIRIQKNKIYLIGALTGGNSVIDANGKRGIELKSVSGNNMQWALVINNMISINSNGISGLDPAGIFLDGTCSYINVYYNSVRVYAGPNDATKSKALFCGAQTHHLQIMNNILSNYSQAYAYYVTSSNNITSSDYNAYYADGEKLAFWGGADRNDLAELQVAGNRDGSSLNEEPFFVAVDDLHSAITNFVSKAQYNTDVIDDIDDSLRSQMPAPTIGADEMTRDNHDMSVVRIISPSMPPDTTFPNNATPPNIESDTVLVKVVFYNNGNSTETNVRWYAFVEGHEATTTSPIRPLGSFTPGQLKVDSVMMPTVLGIINSQSVKVVVLVNGTDDNPDDNHKEQDFYLAPAFNLEAVRMTVPSGCSLQHSPIAITIKNSGFKEMPEGAQFEIGYHTQGYHPTVPANFNSNKLNIATMPDTVREIHTFLTPLSRNSSRDFTFDSLANLYPTDTALNIKVRVNGWCHYQYDVSPDNDSTKSGSSFSPQVDSWYTPDAPIGHDTSFAYGTWGTVTAEQHSEHAPSNLAGRPIRWYRDSTATPFLSPNTYNPSRVWNTTPQYFHDSTYYLQCLSDKSCPSYFSEVHVHVRPRVPVDVGLDGRVLAPLGSRVYMENDTVRVVVSNFGTQTQTNIPIAYQVRKGNNTNPIQTVHDTIRTAIGPGQDYAFTFGELINFNNPLLAANYQLRIWTEMPGDTIRRNDTIRWVEQLRPTAQNNTALDYPFTTRGDAYSYRSNSYDDSYDFVYMAFNEIDVDLPPLGRSSTNFGAFNNPEYRVVHVTRGTVDSLITIVKKSDDPNMRSRAKMAAYIDFDRSGEFGDDPTEIVVASKQIPTLDRVASAIYIPNTASYGYMRMRLVVTKYEDEPVPTLINASGGTMQGHMVDFLLFVDPEPPAVDLAFTQIVSPRNQLIRSNDTVAVQFRVSNKGSQPLTHFTVNYSFTADTVDSTCNGSFQWTGVLMPGTSTIVSLPQHVFTTGTTRLLIWHDLADDETEFNNSLMYEYHKFHVITLRMNENFDSLDWWYAPTGYNNYTRNYWQRATPNKSNIQSAFSGTKAWVTDSLATITTGRRGNVSYLYSPIINIAQIRPDTISLRLLRNLTGGSCMRIEFYNYENQWQNIYHDSILTNWYNDVDLFGFSGTSAGNAYNRYWTPSSPWLSGDYSERTQFRIVYMTPQGDNDNASFGDGCAIDDFYVGRAQRAKDVGVVDIIEPINPKYGQTIYPKVVVKNYGYDTLRTFQVGYTHFGTNLPKVTTYTNRRVAPNGGLDTLLFDSPFIITSEFPDTFEIVAFTILSADIFDDNDTNVRPFYLSPLENDISAEEFIAPLDRVIAGDSTIAVTMRVRNFGTNPISSATLKYIVNDAYSATETVDFVEVLGRPLQSTENFNYTFRQHFLAAMGVMRIVGIVTCDSNDYIYNDTISKRINGISSISDLAAASIIVDTSNSTDIKVTLVIENRGARGANGFELGFWIDNDTTTICRATYSSALPIPALSTGFFMFDTSLVARSAPYDHVTAYVNVDEDNDRTNDTTNIIVSKYVDLEATEVVIEENAGPDCQVYICLRNNGNTAFDRNFNISVTVNGNQINGNHRTRIEPWQTKIIQLGRTIPKDNMRHYVGTGSFTYALDSDPSNNQTNVIRVVNYVEAVPEVGAGQLVLDQNYPNPFTGQTTIPFSIPNASDVSYFVMDALGHIVLSGSGFFQAGSNSIVLDMDRFASGVYYYGIMVNGTRQMRKMVLR